MSLYFRCGLLAAIWLTIPVGGLAHQDADEPDHDRIHGPEHEHDALEEVIVSATLLPMDVVEMSQSATVLRGDALHRELANNIGETLNRLPGLANASFGQNVGRPVIRGQQGVRVGLLNNNMSSGDAAAVSQDHAVPTEPFLADQVEVLRGPTTLLYGSGAIGGVVNLVMTTIPTDLPENGVEGRAMVEGNSVADERFAAGRLDVGGGQFAAHVSGFYRRSDDYEIPGFAELEPDESHDDDGPHDEEEEVFGILENSFLDNQGGAIGGSWIGDDWRFGLSWTGYESDYGIPGAHHHHEEHAGEEEQEEEDEEAPVTIELETSRIDAELEGNDPFGGFERLKLNVAVTNYQHTEFEGTEIGTVFDNDTSDARLELRHKAWGAWTGALGGQYTDRDFSAVGEEAFVPPSATRTLALFWVETAEFADWRIDLGMRYEDVDVTALGELGHHDDDEAFELAEGPEQRSFNPLSVSGSALWHVDDRSHLAINLAYAERAPSDAELFSFGPHLATQTFEVGDPTLDIESNVHLEVSYRVHQGPLTGSLTLYRDDFGDFIYEADTGVEADELPVRFWSQQDAEFTGAELELRWDMGRNAAGHWQAFGFYDRVKAELADGNNVPRIPPQRIGLGLDWDHARWAGNVTWIHADDHTRTAEFETPTPGYDLLNAELSWYVPVGDRADLTLYLKGRNLLDEDIRHSTSFLKDQAPQAGRNVVLGVRGTF